MLHYVVSTCASNILRRDQSCKAIFNFTVVYKARVTLAHQSEPTCCFFRPIKSKPRPVMTWLTCIFPRLTRIAIFVLLRVLIGSICGCCQCAGSYRSQYVRKVALLSSACKNVIPLRFKILKNKREYIISLAVLFVYINLKFPVDAELIVLRTRMNNLDQVLTLGREKEISVSSNTAVAPLTQRCVGSCNALSCVCCITRGVRNY